MTSNKPRTMRYENALYFTDNVWHRAHDPPSSRTASFGAVVVCGRLHRRGALGELPGGGFVGILVAGIGGPTKQDLVVWGIRVGQNLEDSSKHARLWAIATESLVEERELFWTHSRCATPIRPRCLALFVIVRGHEIDHRMDEAQDKAFGGPADDDVDRHIVVVQSDLVSIAPLWQGAGVAQEAAHPREAAIPNPGARVRYRVKLYRADTDLVTVPCIVRCSRASVRSALAEACSSGWTKLRRDFPVRSSA